MQALDLFDELIASNLTPNQSTFAALAAAHARAGNWARVGEVLRHMGAPGSGTMPAAATYATLFRVLEERLVHTAAAAGGGGVCGGGGAVGEASNADRAAACARWALSTGHATVS